MQSPVEWLQVWDASGQYNKHLGAIKAAKNRLGINNMKVRPVPANVHGSGIVLCIGGHPPFACDHVVSSGASDLDAAVETWLTGVPKSRIYRYEDCIAVWLGVKPSDMREVNYVDEDNVTDLGI